MGNGESAPDALRLLQTKKLPTKLMDTTELISTRHDCLSFAPKYSKGLSLKLWIFYKQKGSIALELLGFS
jgi:hypothetical protein